MSIFRIVSLFSLLLVPTFCVGAEITQIRVGIDGYYKNGFWTPMRISWNAEVGQIRKIEILTIDPDGTPTNTEFDAPQDQLESIVYAKLGRNTGEITVRLIGDDNAPLAESSLKPILSEVKGTSRKLEQLEKFSNGNLFLSPVSPDRPIVLVLGNSDCGILDAIGFLRISDSRRPVVVIIDSLDKIPSDSLGFDCVETIFITTSVTEMWEGRTVNDPKIEALASWLRLGGQLVFAPGKASEPFINTPDSPLARFLPGRFERMTQLRNSKQIELYTESNRAIIMDGSEVAPYIEMPILSEIDGVVELSERDIPIIVRRNFGFGTIAYFGGDLDDLPMNDWRDRGNFMLRLLNWAEIKSKSSGGNRALIHLGYGDFSGQIRSSMDRFIGGTPVFSLILILIAVYVLIIGPGDWFIVHKIIKKPILTWFTFPLWIVLFSFLGFYFATSVRTRPAQLNKVDLIDIDPNSSLVRVSTWGGIFSPKDSKYDVVFEPRWNRGDNSLSDKKMADIIHPDAVNFCWLGLSGSGLGGMEPKTVSPTLWREPYRISYQTGTHGEQCNRLSEVPIRIRSSKPFYGQWSSVFPSVPFQNTRLSRTEGIPAGKLTNDLPVAIDNAVLVYGGWALKVGRLESGESIELGLQTMRRDVITLLNSTKSGISEEQSRASTQHLLSYNTQSYDVWPILRTLTFYKAFGGFDSIGLHNSLQPNLDWSDSLGSNRAILIANLDTETGINVGSSITIQTASENEPSEPIGDRSAVVRVLIPVE